MKRIYVIDTCYLLELYAVPGFSTEQNITEIRKRVTDAAAEDGLFFVTLPCAVEVSNHLADSHRKGKGQESAKQFFRDFDSSVVSKKPYNLTPCYDTEKAFHGALKYFSEELLALGVGLCDAFTIKEAEALASKYHSFGYVVHIWTLDKQVKAREPDAEPKPFVGP